MRFHSENFGKKFRSIPGVSSLYSTQIMCLQKTTSNDFCIFTFVESNNSNFGIQYHMVAWQSNATLSKRLLSRFLLRLAETGDAANFGFLCPSFESVFLLKTTEKRNSVGDKVVCFVLWTPDTLNT